MLALLRDPRDCAAGFRLLLLMPGVGPVPAQRVLDFIVETADPIGEIANAPMPSRVGAGEDWSPFVETAGTTLRPRRFGPPNWTVSRL